MKKFTRWILPLIVSLTVGVPVWCSYIIPDLSVTTAKLASGAVTSAKIAAGAAASNIGNNGVTQAMRVPLGQQISSSSGSFSTTSQSNTTAVTNLSVSITTTGRPVFVGLIDDGTGCTLGVQVASAPTVVAAQGVVNLLRASSTISSASINFSISSATGLTGNYTQTNPCSSIWIVDVVAAGTYTYSVHAFSANANPTTVFVQNTKLLAYEL